MRRLPVAACLAALAACAAPAHQAPPAAVPAHSPAPAPPPEEPGVPIAVTLPDITTYGLIRTDGGKMPAQVLALGQAADLLAGYDVVFLGEVHRHVGNQRAQMDLFREIHKRAPNVALSMEQFERDVQSVLDDYLAGKTGEVSLAEKGRAWQSYGTTYRPLVEYAKEHHLPVIAANAPEQVIRCVGREGLGFLTSMSPAARGWAAAEVHAGEGKYRDKFMGFAMGDAGHGGGKKGDAPSAQAIRGFEAQATRDDTMAESIFLHLQKNPGRKVVHLTGSFHSDDFLGTVERLQMRDPKLKIAVVSPTDYRTADNLTLKASDAAGGTMVLALRALPRLYVTADEMRAAMRGQSTNREKVNCKM
ncbi:MAG: ChaN family lipoprotein [Rhodospirillaceae bacterium]|nr:ChaN family lipoprotein [Rhodospirillaceae bacterium]